MSFIKRLLPLFGFLTGFPLETHALDPISPAALESLRVVEEMEVEKHWLAGSIVDWRTGEPTGKPVRDSGKHTHCSQFAAAASERLGVYILRPPEHSAVLLANAQYEWLAGEAGRKEGWLPLGDGAAAQDAANRGDLVVAVYKNHDPKKSGHIALVRPGEKTEADIAREGPDVIQAGGTNRTRTSLKKGFANHARGFAEIRFYAHPLSHVKSVAAPR